MTATVRSIFNDTDASRVNDATHIADQAVWWQQQLANARFALERPDLHTDDELRDACATMKTRWGTATDECMADAMIHTLNERDRMRRHADAKAETSGFDEVREYRKQLAVLILGGLAVIALVVAGVV